MTQLPPLLAGLALALDDAHDLPEPPPHAPAVLAWCALARAFQHTWVKRFDAMPEGEPLADLDALCLRMGGDSAQIGGLFRNRGTRAYEHVSKTKRIRWSVGDDGVWIRVTRPSVENWADPEEHEIVIELAIYPDVRPMPRITLDEHKIMQGEYGRRHVAVMHTALFALVGVPGGYGLTKKQATILVKMIAAGAS